MSWLVRPYIPIAVRVKVAERQLLEREMLCFVGSLSTRLKFSLQSLFWNAKETAELHHRPALVNRQRKRNGDYEPPANDPDYLVYIAEDDHDIETRVRGLHGQHSDLGMARKNKRIARNRDPKRRKTKIRSANRWPPKGSQKLPRRRT